MSIFRIEDIKYKITKEKMPTKSGKLKVKGIGDSVRGGCIWIYHIIFSVSQVLIFHSLRVLLKFRNFWKGKTYWKVHHYGPRL